MGDMTGNGFSRTTPWLSETADGLEEWSTPRRAICAHLGTVKAFSSHEHIGSLTSFGQVPGPWFPSDVAPALKPGCTTLLELLFTPYMAPQLFAAGAAYPPPEAFREDEAFLRAINAIRPCLSAMAGIGVLTALDRGLAELYGMGLHEAMGDPSGAWMLALNKAVSDRYAGYFVWYADVMKKTDTQGVLKPVHPEYVTSLEKMGPGAGEEELSHAVPILRVESLVGFFDDMLGLDFSGVEQPAGFPVEDADSLDRMIAWFFGLVDRFEIRAIKQLQAYSRTISTSSVSRTEMAEALGKILAHRQAVRCAEGVWPVAQCGEAVLSDVRGVEAGSLAAWMPELRKTAMVVQDYILRRILEEADSRGLPYQIHTGMTTLADSNPALLEPQIRHYRNVRFVLLHAYPFLPEAAYLARNHPNVWVDTSWLALQSPDILRNALIEYVGMVPAARITASIDATSLEEYTGGLSVTRDMLCDVLSEKVERGCLSVADAMQIGERVLAGNAKALYRL